MQSESIEIVDRGRGPQLSTSRVTVQDLVPYFQAGYPQDEILRWMPSLTRAELEIVERYYQQHKAALDEEDKRISAYVAEQVRLQRARYPEETSAERRARLEENLRRRRQERNGERHTGGQ